MPGRQRTFELIPTTLVTSDGPRRPMTSKAAKKAYQQKNRGPRVSRAEQRRLEAEELARQKKEYEKERATIKSKAAREKKAAKEQAEKDERKRKGLPEPSKFVRASQPTISRFVRDGNKRTWQQMESVSEDSDDTICALEDAGPPSKRSPREPNRVMAEDESEDEFGDFPSFSQLPALFEKIDSSLNNPEEKNIGSPQLPERKATTKTDQAVDDEDMMADIQHLSEAAEAEATMIDANHQSPPPANISSNPSQKINQSRPVIVKPIHVKPESPEVPRAALQERSINMPPPRTVITKPTRFKSLGLPLVQDRSTNMLPPPRGPLSKPSKPKSFAPPPPDSKAPSFNPQKPQIPSATQAFLENHLDDFFPSPSQQVRELLDDIDDFPSNTQVAREISPIKKPSEKPQPARELSPTREVEDYSFDFICTQDFDLSPQDILEINTPSKPPVEKREPTPPRPPIMKKRRFFEEKEADKVYVTEEDELHAAIQESAIEFERKKLESAAEEALMSEAQTPGPTKRTLQRIASSCTDYGDEEFEELELIALC